MIGNTPLEHVGRWSQTAGVTPANDNEWDGAYPRQLNRREKVNDLLMWTVALVGSALIMGIPIAGLLRGAGLWFW